MIQTQRRFDPDSTTDNKNLRWDVFPNKEAPVGVEFTAQDKTTGRVRRLLVYEEYTTARDVLEISDDQIRGLIDGIPDDQLRESFVQLLSTFREASNKNNSGLIGETLKGWGKAMEYRKKINRQPLKPGLSPPGETPEELAQRRSRIYATRGVTAREARVFYKNILAEGQEEEQ